MLVLATVGVLLLLIGAAAAFAIFFDKLNPTIAASAFLVSILVGIGFSSIGTSSAMDTCPASVAAAALTIQLAEAIKTGHTANAMEISKKIKALKAMPSCR
jgi:hypothetical protein